MLLLAVILLPLASAETYRISGKATYADGSAVQLDYVSVQCEQSNFDCYQYRGTNAITDAYGDFTIVIDADVGEDDLDILLALRGETFTHTIDISAHENSSQSRLYQDIQLEQNPPPSGVFMGFGCFIVLFVLVFVSVLLRTGRRLATPRGRMEFMGYRPARELECPKCKESVVQHELVKHLIIEHDLDPLDAGQLTGKVMRRLWSEEE
ncbi:MAG: hypothetical protein DWC09_00340 [Candidatus Poseidoniales archaeon]|nr:MAG: hypothetical protein DWC09_00340 [Candidatus Poseidoniales archaeon]